jgi:hypothetical protein
MHKGKFETRRKPGDHVASDEFCLSRIDQGEVFERSGNTTFGAVEKISLLGFVE